MKKTSIVMLQGPRHRTCFLTLALLLVMDPLNSGRAANKNAGTSGAQFLKIGAGARPTAMGGAFVGMADDVHAVYYNPAGLSNLKKIEVTAMHAQWFQDVNYQFGAVASPTQWGTFGVSVLTLKIDDLSKRLNDESLSGQFEDLNAAYALSYGRALTKSFSLGLTAQYIKQEIDTASAGTWASDVGALKTFGRFPLRLGLALRHLGPKVKFKEEGDALPRTIDIGASSRLLKDRLGLTSNIALPRDNGLQLGLGTEWKQPLLQDFNFSLRAGYNNTGTDAAGTTGISLGGGIGFRSFSLDFAWVPFGDLGNTFRYSALLKF